MKRCKKCGATKPLDDFYREKSGRDGYRPECKACNLAARKAWYERNAEREIARVKQWQQANQDRVNKTRRIYRAANRDRMREGHLKRRFGLTLESYAELLEAQGVGCAICGRQARAGSSLHVDHDHETGEVRGLLCFSCNASIGKMADDPERLVRAADYLSSGGFVPGGVTELAGLARARAAALVSASPG
jgi:hypothetical protein